MKFYSLLTFCFLLAFTAVAQIPYQFSYQAIARDKNGQPISKQVKVQFTILQGSATGTIVFREEHTLTTNSFGLFSPNIGTGTLLQGKALKDLDWTKTPYFLKIEVDNELLGTQQLMTVPYAIVADTVLHAPKSSGGTVYTGGTGISVNGSTISIAAGTIPTTLPPNGTAGGDLSGSYPTPSVKALLGRTLAPTAPTNGQVLKFNLASSSWEPSTDIVGTGGGITYTGGTGILVTGSTISVAAGTIPTTLPPNGAAGGDLSGTYPTPSVKALLGKALGTTPPSEGQVLKYNQTSSSWEPSADNVGTGGGGSITYTGGTGISVSGSTISIAAGTIPTTLPPNGAAGGDLSGTYPTPSVKALLGKALATTPPSDGQVLKYKQLTNSWEPAADNGGIGGTDSQTLTLNPTTNILSISNGNTVNLSPYLDNTDSQSLSMDSTSSPSQYKLSLSGSTNVVSFPKGGSTSTTGGITLPYNNTFSSTLIPLQIKSTTTSAIKGYTSSSTSSAIEGIFEGTNPGNGVYGFGNNNSIGVKGEYYGTNPIAGVMGFAKNFNGIGIVGENEAGGLAARFKGGVDVTNGNLSVKDGRSFYIKSKLDTILVSLEPDKGQNGSIITFNADRKTLSYLFSTPVGTVGKAAYLALASTVGTSHEVISLGTRYFENEYSTGYLAVNDKDGASKVRLFVDAAGVGHVEANGVKSFVMDHPTKPDKEIVYASIEGAEAGAYERGTATLKDGEAFIPFSEHFALVVNPKTLTVSLTAQYWDTFGLAVVEKTASGIRVKELKGGTGNFSFDWEVKGVRKGFENFEVIRNKVKH
jgi:hypothetical protein